jgi:signal transduction histidine kinase
MLVLLVRRRHPLLMISLFCISGAGASLLQVRLSDTSSDAFVPVVALIVMSYALGAYAGTRGLALGAPQPILLIALVDAVDPGTEDVVSGLVFASAFVVLLPVVAGRLVRSRRRLARELGLLEAEAAREHARRVRLARAEESVAVSELLDRTLDAGRERLLATDDIATVEAHARGLLATTRDAVVGLSQEEPPRQVPSRGPSRTAHTDDSGQTWSVLVAAALGAGLLVETSADWRSVPAGLALVAVVVGALVWIARRPLEGAVLSWVAATTLSRGVAPLGDTFSGIGLTVGEQILVCWLAPRRRAGVAVAAGLVGAVAGIEMGDPAGALTLTALAAFGGAILRDRTTLLAEVRTARADSVDRRRDELQVAIVEQRATLARELHDSIGHALTVVALQAGAARRLRDTDPPAAAGARAAIERTARQALDDLRRGFTAGPGIGDLLDTARAAGLEADVTGPPPPADLAPVVHRILQEALTNVMRHAPGARVVVRLGRDDDAYSCTVRNPLAPDGPTYPSAGRGLPGMRARAEAIGGTVEWRADEEGFTVTATFPIRVGAGR